MSAPFSTESLFDLPVPLLATVLTEWVGISSVVNLDSACCSRTSRNLLLSLCHQEQVAFSMRYVRSSHSYFEWLIARKFYVSECNYSLGTDVALFATFLSAKGKWLRNLAIQGNAVDPVNNTEIVAISRQVSLNCAHLNEIAFIECCLFPCIADIFTANVNLTSIVLEECLACGNYPVDVTALPVLGQLFITKCKLTTSCAQYLGNLSAQTKKLKLFKDGMDFHISHALMYPLMNLQCLDLWHSNLLDGDLMQIVSRCPQISKLMTSRCNHLTEAGVIYAVERLKLKSLNLMDTRFTDTLLHAVGNSCTTLHTLLVEGTRTFTAGAIANVVKRCVNLRMISMGWIGVPVSPFVTLVAPELRNITNLVFARNLKCNEMLLAVAKYCTKLVRLDISDEGNRCNSSIGNALAKILKDCLHLRLLIMTAADIDLHFSGTARSLLECFRPDIRLSTDYTL